jgi:hypothetical protein
MTQLIQKTQIETRNVVSANSRYIQQNIVYYGENKFLTFDLYIRKRYRPTGKEKVMVITKGAEYRPDLVAFDVYGSSNYWWSILEANNMSDIYQFVSGKTIILPILM